jgi:tRNA-intron endonuclease
MPTGVLLDDQVLVEDEREGTQLYNKGAFGTPRSGGGLVLSLVEAAFLAESGRLAVRTPAGDEVSAAGLLATGAAAEALFEVRWVAYRDLRSRSLIVKPGSNGAYSIWARGTLPGRDRPAQDIVPASERGAFDPQEFLARAREGARGKRSLLAALVDDEADVTYYAVRDEDPRGAAALKPLPKGLPGEALLLTDRALVEDPALRGVLEAQDYGRRLGALLELSIAEAAYLREAHGLAVRAAARTRGRERDGSTSPEAALRTAGEAEPEFALRLSLYRDLRSRGLVAKTGLKYGTHFRVYRRAVNETHAPFLVHAIRRDDRIPWVRIAGLVRMAHGVRKTLLLYVVEEEAYVSLSWTRP